MKSDEEIGREIASLIWTDPSVIRDKYAAKIGAAARKAVGEPPRMMIQGMSVDNLMNAFDEALTDPKRPCESIYVTCAKEAYRLANTPAEPEADPDAFVKEVWVKWETARLSRLHAGEPPDPIPFEQAYPWEQAACRAVAKFLEERE